MFEILGLSDEINYQILREIFILSYFRYSQLQFCLKLLQMFPGNYCHLVGKLHSLDW